MTGAVRNATSRVVEDARRALVCALHGAEEFSCLAGSFAWARPSPTSDIDLLVVIPDDVGFDSAVAAREAFTHAYVDLHRRHRRYPDLDWPGEFLYRRDLEDAIGGGAFSPGPEGAPRLRPEPAPQRFWISMVASSVALTGVDAHASFARRCAELVVQVARGGLPTAGATAADRFEAGLALWGLDRRVLRGCPRIASLHRAVSASAPMSMTSVSSPSLDTAVDRWRTTARERWRGPET